MSASPRFVGRQAELATLDGALGDACAGRPRIVLVEGDPGIGKTALLRRCAHLAAGATVVWASGDEAESIVDFGVVRQVFAGMSVPAPSVSDPFAIGAAMLDALGAVERRGPVVLVLDDLQWADLPSSQALLFCLRRLRVDPVLVLAACRPGGVQPLGAGWARLLADGDRANLVALEGLSVGEVGDLAAAMGRDVGRATAERLAAHTGGNPLYVTAMLTQHADALRPGVTPVGLRLDAAEPLPAPRAYAMGVVASLARLSAPARELVCAAAVIGVRAPLRLAAIVAGSAPGVDGLDEVMEAGLIDLATDGDVVFRHPLMRAAVYESLAPSHRRRLHLAAAPLLPPMGALAHRVSATAGGYDTGLAAELVAASVVAQAQGAFTLAVQQLIWAWQVDPDRPRARRSLYDATRLMLMTGAVHRARELRAAIAACPPDPWRRYTEALFSVVVGQLRLAGSELQSVFETCGDAELAGCCAADLALVRAALGHYQDAIRWARRAGVHATPPAARASALQALAWSNARLGRFDETNALLQECSPHTPDPTPLDAELLTIRGVVRNWAGDYGAAIADLQAVLRWQRRGVPTSGIVNAYAALAEAEFRSGMWDLAAEHIGLGLSLADDIDQTWFLAYACTVAACVAAAQGRDARSVRALADDARDAAAAQPSSESLGYAALAGAVAARVAGDWAGVITALQPLGVDRPDSPASHPNLARWRYHLAYAYLSTGDVTHARSLWQQSEDLHWGGVDDADRSRLGAAICRAVGDIAGAASTYAAACSGSRRLSDGLLALDHGEFLVAQHRRRHAVGVLHAAQEIFTELGAARLGNRAGRALAACGVATGPSEHPRDGLDLLTERERTVARLVASGMTNREVAAELYVSVKAVEYHLVGIFATLGIRSRRDIPGTPVAPGHRG